VNICTPGWIVAVAAGAHWDVAVGIRIRADAGVANATASITADATNKLERI
jgi:hypothetical protein